MLVREYANASNIFLYIVLVLSTVNYNVIISFLPAFKNLCVGLLVVTTTLLLRNFELTGRPTIYVIGAMFFYFIGKEMLNDIIDAKGDGNTLVKQIGITRAQYPAFGMKFLADTFLLMGSTNPLSVTLALSLAGSDIVCVYLWRTENPRHWVASIMTLQSVVGIYYLF